MKTSADDPQVDAYLAALPSAARDVAAAVRGLIRTTVPDATESWKWKHPCYAAGSLFCAFKVNQKHITLVFNEGTSLDDPNGLLEGTGKAMRHVKIRFDDAALPEGTAELIRAAADRAG